MSRRRFYHLEAITDIPIGGEKAEAWLEEVLAAAKARGFSTEIVWGAVCEDCGGPLPEPEDSEAHKCLPSFRDGEWTTMGLRARRTLDPNEGGTPEPAMLRAIRAEAALTAVQAALDQFHSPLPHRPVLDVLTAREAGETWQPKGDLDPQPPDPPRLPLGPGPKPRRRKIPA
jgi:hypothetical protein